MINKEVILQQIEDKGIVAVVRANNQKEALFIIEACLAGGINTVEVTFTVPGADSLIKDLSLRYKSDQLIIGAGTVLDVETARIAILSGAQFIVSPFFDKNLTKLCNRYRIANMPGALTIKEVVKAMEYGADIIKLFPGDLGGPSSIKAIKGPIPQAKIMPTGGVNVSNVNEWIKAGAVAVGAGSSLLGPAKTGDYKQITNLAKEFIREIKETRKNL